MDVKKFNDFLKESVVNKKVKISINGYEWFVDLNSNPLMIYDTEKSNNGQSIYDKGITKNEREQILNYIKYDLPKQTAKSYESSDYTSFDDQKDIEYLKYDSLLQGKYQDAKELAHDTNAVRKDSYIAIEFHDEEIIKFFPDDSFELNNKTGDRKVFIAINSFLPDGYRLSKKGDIVYLITPSDSTPFASGMIVK